MTRTKRKQRTKSSEVARIQEWRANNPDRYAEQRARAGARHRAMMALREMHPKKYERLYHEELRAIGLPDE